MLHERERLALGLEARDEVTGVHAHLDQLDGDAAAHRLALLGFPHLAHAALADAADEVVGADARRRVVGKARGEALGSEPSGVVRRAGRGEGEVFGQESRAGRASEARVR